MSDNIIVAGLLFRIVSSLGERYESELSGNDRKEKRIRPMSVKQD